MRAPLASFLIVAFTFAGATARAEGNSTSPTSAKPSPSSEAAMPVTASDAAKPTASPDAVNPATRVDDRAGAKKLFDEAVELASGGDFAAACPKLEQSLALHAGLGTQFHLAGCWSKIGRTASAYALYETVATKSHELGQAEREEVALARMEALLPRLSRVRIDITNPAPKTEVKRDGISIPQSDWGKPVPLDRGTHELVVTAEGKTPWSTHVDLADPAVTIAVQVPPLSDAPKPVAAVVVVAKPASPTASPPAEPKKTSSGSGRRTLAIVVGGVGVAALAAGIFKGAEYVDKNNEAESICPSGANCSSDEIAQHQQAVDAARQARTWAYVGIGVGAAALVGGGVLFFTAPHGPSKPEHALRLRVLPLADGRGTWGGALHGSF